MALLRLPSNSGAVADVRDEDVDRYLEAGWTKSEDKSETTKAPAKKAASSRTKK